MSKRNKVTIIEPQPKIGSLTAKQLQQTTKDKHKVNKEIYRTILADCEKKIKYQNSLGNSQTILRIPFMLFDKPLYNITHAIMYVMKKLKENGFTMMNIYENNIQVKWK